eukprot:4047677-Amphidinium_carterae.1
MSGYVATFLAASAFRVGVVGVGNGVVQGTRRLSLTSLDAPKKMVVQEPDEKIEDLSEEPVFLCEVHKLAFVSDGGKIGMCHVFGGGR